MQNQNARAEAICLHGRFVVDELLTLQISRRDAKIAKKNLSYSISPLASRPMLF